MQQKASPQAFQRLIEPLLAGLYRAAYRLAGNRADAQDLVQDTCVLAWERSAELTDASHL
ncbi:RNA polymerase sigma factor, partial [Salmonella enterica]|uniref:RNA polymerase sigma factor n=1 Tax=Salmonella enterica TaxID=28901 RepID=UPI003CE6A24E